MATYYWIGTSGGTWDTVTTTNWSATSGGAGGAGVPGSADTATFDINSGANTITTSGAISITTLSLSTGFTGTVTFGGGVIVSGIVTQNQGTLNTNGQTCSWGQFSATVATTRVLTMGASSITLTAASVTAWNVTTTTGLTISTNTATITAAGASQTLTMGSVSYNGTSVVINSTGSFTFTNGTTLAALTYAPPVAIANIFGFSGSPTITGTLTLTGAAPPNRILIESTSLGTPHALICNGTVTAAYVDFQDVTGAGTASWNLSAITGGSGNCLGCSGITFTTAQTNYWVGNTANWSSAAAWASSSGGAANSGRVPLPQDSVTFDANSFTSTGRIVTGDTPKLGTTITWTGATNSPTWKITTSAGMYGSLTCIGAMSFSGSSSGIHLKSRTNSSLTTGGVGMVSLSCDVISASLILADNCIFGSGSTLALTSGTLDASVNNVNVSTASVSMSGTVAETLNMGSGTWTLLGTGTVWNNTSTALTLNAGTSTIVLADTSATAKTFAGNGKTYSTLQITTGGTGSVTITGANTFAGITCNGTKTLVFPHAVTQTLSSSSGWQVVGTNNGYEALPGISGNYISTPTSTALDITGDIDVRCQLSLASWAPSRSSTLVTKYQTIGQYSWQLWLTAGNQLSFGITSDGSTLVNTGTSVQPSTVFSAGQTGWVRVTRQQSNGTTLYYTSFDGATWTQLGASTTLAAGSAIFNGTSEVEIGSYANGTVNQLIGNIYRAQIYSGIAGTLELDANFNAKAVGQNSFTESSSNAATITIAGVAAQQGDGRVLIASDLAATQWTLSSASGQVTSRFLSLQDSAATGGATFNAGSQSGNISDNTGWLFSTPSTVPSEGTMLTLGVG
jgi:hypothetical protein